MFHLKNIPRRNKTTLQNINPASVPSLAAIVLALQTLFSGKLDRDQSRGSKMPPDAPLWFHMLSTSACVLRSKACPNSPTIKAAAKGARSPNLG